MKNLADNVDLTVTTKVLGLVWNKQRDTLSCDIRQHNLPEKITERTVLSFVNQIFDSISFTCPATLLPKLILQEIWVAKMGWDEELPKDSATKLFSWCEDLNNLKLIQINRDMHGGIYECEVAR